MNRVAVLAALAVVLSVVFAVRSRRTRRRVASRMAGRPELSCAAFGERHFEPAQAEVAARVRQILSRHVRLDLSRLAPEDRPLADLEMETLNRGSSYRFFLDLEREFECELEDGLLDEDVTMREIVQAIAASRPDTGSAQGRGADRR